MDGVDCDRKMYEETDMIFMIDEGRLIALQDYVVIHKGRPNLTGFLQNKFDRGEFFLTAPPFFSFPEIMERAEQAESKKRKRKPELVYVPSESDSETETDSEKTEYSSSNENDD